MIQLAPYNLPDLRPWQRKELLGYWAVPKHAINADPRTGKTFVAAPWLRGLANLGVERMLVTAPLGACPMWEKVLADTGLPTLPYYDETSTRARSLLRPGRSRAPAWSGVLLLNVDKLWAVRDLLYGNIQAYICDEAHEVCSPSSHRGLAARHIAREATYVRTLTATPAPNHRGDFWSLLHMVGGYPGTWTEFSEHFLVRDFMIPSIIKDYINVEELDALIAAHCTIVPRESVFGPDEIQFIRRAVKLPETMMATYQRLAREWVIDDPVPLLADHTLTRLLRLQQLTSGFLPSGDGEGTLKTLHTAKIDAALADLSEIIAAGQKAVVFHRFVAEGALMQAELRRRGVPTFEINGTLDGHGREAQRQAFTDAEGAAVIVVQIQSGGVSISLAAAHHALYLSRTFSFVHDKQSRDRIFREHEVRQVTYYEVEGTIDSTIARTLARKQNMHEAIQRLSAQQVAFGEAA